MRILTRRTRLFVSAFAIFASVSMVACAANEAGFTDFVSTGDPCNTIPSNKGQTINGNVVITDPGSIVGNTNSTTGNGNATSGPHATASFIQLPLSGCFASDYTAAVRLGDGSHYQLIVDTGSTTLAVAATACTNCSGISPTYTPGAKASDDHYSTSGLYGDGSSWSGEIFNDVVSMGSGNDVTMAFATIDRQSMSRLSGRNFFNASYCSGSAMSNASQGIIGFGVAKLALTHTDAFADKFHTNNNLPDVFAAQFCDQGGNLWLGGYDPNSTTSAPVYTPMNTTNGFYEVTLQDMLLGGVPVGSTSAYGAAVVDTGTSVMIVTTSLFDTLGTALDNSAQFVSYFGPGFLANGSCSVPASQATRAQLDAALPKMVLEFPDSQGNIFQVQMNATDSYLMAMKQPDGTVGYCAAVASGGGSGGIPNVLLGNNVMHSQITIFDRASSRLGMAPQVGCNRL